MRGQQPRGIAHFLFDELRGAIQDIRQKIIEEGWFGRVVSAAPVVEMERADTQSDTRTPDPGSADLDRRPSFEELWGAREPAREPVEPDHGIDR